MTRPLKAIKPAVLVITSFVVLIYLSSNHSKMLLKKTLGFVIQAYLTLPIMKNSQNYPHSHQNELAGIKCIGAANDQGEDIFCLQRPTTLQNYKNPCWKDENGTLRCLPYFHLGTSKCGSTDLFHRIRQHPDVLNCSTCHRDGKETWYWAWARYGSTGNKGKGKTSGPLMLFSQYLQMFDRATKRIDEEESADGYHNKIIGDGSPMDFWDFRSWTKIPQNEGLSEPRVLTPHLIRHMYTDFRMILIFRDPIDRLYSDYFFLGKSKFRSPESFHRDAVESIEMIRKCLRKNNSTAACFYSLDMYLKLPTRITIGCYSVFLKVWLSVFPREKFLVLRTEDLQESPEKTLLEVFEFLKLRSLDAALFNDILKGERQNVTPLKLTAPRMLNRTRILLSEFYSQYNTELANILKDERFLWSGEKVLTSPV